MQGATQTAYRHLSSHPTSKEIQDIFTPSDNDISFAK